MRRVLLADGQSVGFNMTAMIDVIFLLLVFFLCINQYQKLEQDPSIELPVAKSPAARRPAEPTGPLVVTVLPGRGLESSGRAVAETELDGLLERHRRTAAPATPTVWIRADRHVAYGVIEPILVACARAGIWKVAIKVTTIERAP